MVLLNRQTLSSWNPLVKEITSITGMQGFPRPLPVHISYFKNSKRRARDLQYFTQIATQLSISLIEAMTFQIYYIIYIILYIYYIIVN